MTGYCTGRGKSMVGKNIDALTYFINNMDESEYKDKFNIHCLIH